MDLLSNFQFFAAAEQPAQAPEVIKFRGLPQDGRTFSSLMQVPSGPGEAAPQTIGQRLVLPGDAGNRLPLSGESLPATEVGGIGNDPVAGEQRLAAEWRRAPVTRFGPAPAFFGKDRIEAFAAPARGTDAPADVPDDWSGRADYIREEFVFLGPPARQVARPLPALDELPAAIKAKDAASNLAPPDETRVATVTNAVGVADADWLERPASPPEGEVSRQPSGSTGAAMPARHGAGAAEGSPGHGMSLDDFPRASAAVLPGETGAHRGPPLSAVSAQREGDQARAEQAARTRGVAVADKLTETGAVPVLRRKVQIQVPDGDLSTRVELARTPASYSSATAPVRPPETGDPTATHRAQALVDAMPRFRTHKRIGVTPTTPSVGRTAKYHDVEGVTAAPPKTATSAGPGALSSGAERVLHEAAAKSARAESIRPAGVVLQGSERQTRTETPGGQPNPVPGSAPASKLEVPAAAPRPADSRWLQTEPGRSAPPAERTPSPASPVSVSRTDPLTAQTKAPASPGTFTAASATAWSDAAPIGASGLPSESGQAMPRNTNPTPGQVVGSDATIAARNEPAARFAESLGKSERVRSASTSRFVTEQGSVVESVRVSTTDSTPATGVPTTSNTFSAPVTTVPQFRLSAAPGSERWSQALGERVVLMMRGEQQVARIMLNPEHLGALEVQVRVKDEQAQVWLQAQSPQAREALENALPRLREMLAEQGLDLARDHGSEQRRAYERAEHSQRRGDADSWRQAAADDEPGDDNGGRRGGHDGLIDRYI